MNVGDQRVREREIDVKKDETENSVASHCYLKVGDRVVAQTKITRADNRSAMSPGDTGVITHVYKMDNSQIVGVKPDGPNQLTMIDIVCMFDMPAVFRVIR